MQLLLTTKRNFTFALWMPVRLSATAPGVLEGTRKSVMRRILACVESQGGHLDHLLQMYPFGCNSQIKSVQTRVKTNCLYIRRNVKLQSNFHFDIPGQIFVTYSEEMKNVSPHIRETLLLQTMRLYAMAIGSRTAKDCPSC
jgi:hypothetical protein